MWEYWIEKDKALLVAMNNGHTELGNNVWWVVSQTSTWVPVLLVLTGIIVYRKRWEALWIVGGIAFAILLADQLSSSIIKPMVERLRPTHEPSLEGMVETVNGYEGGMYGFVSSHAANCFAVTMFLILLFQNSVLSVTMVTWTLATCYSRVYLGVHYPGDIVCGAMIGILCGWLSYSLLKKIRWESLSVTNTGALKTRNGFVKSDGWLCAMSMIITFVMIFLFSF